MKRNLLACILLITLNSSLFAQEIFKVMFYNVLNFPNQPPATRVLELETIIDDYRPDIFMICELNSEQGADDILSMMQTVNANYTRATFVFNTSDDGIGNQNDLQNMIFYDSTKFTLETQSEVTTIFRDFNHYTLRINTIDQATDPIKLHAFVTHLKSSSGVDNQNYRLQMVNDFVAYLNTMPSDSYIILGGDLNFYTNSEPGFQELTDVTNSITMVDPANRVGSWHNNTSYLDVFTQSTRTQSGLGGATGGFDDRFDFILTSENILTNPDIFYVPNSYQVYGNNNNSSCYNQEINSSNCSGAEFGTTIRDALYYMSDHLPVTMELQTNEVLSTNSVTQTGALKIKGTNLVEDWLVLEYDHTQLESDKLYIHNAMGQRIMTFKLAHLNATRLKCV